MKRGMGPIQVFYAYALADEPFLQELEKHLSLLQRQGMIVGWHPQLVVAGEPGAQQVEQALNEASLILLLISADFLASDDCYEQQMQRALQRQQRGEVQVLPIQVRPVHWQNAPFAHLPVVPTNRQPITSWASQDAAWTHIAEAIRCVLEGKPLPVIEEQKAEARQSVEYAMEGHLIQGFVINDRNTVHQHYYTTASPKPHIPPVILSLRASSFVGREEDVTWLLQQLKVSPSTVGRVVSISGPGGMGKTALAAEVLACLVRWKGFADCYPDGIFYHSFYTSPSLAGACEQLVRLFEEEPGSDSYHAAVRVLSRRRLLLVFDGVETLEETQLLRALGSKSVTLLLSRRQSDASDPAHSRKLELLTPEQGCALLQNVAGSRAADCECVVRLVQEIGGYPLALHLIGGYLTSRQEDVSEYLEHFEQDRQHVLQHPELHQGNRETQSVQLVLQRSYTSLSQEEQRLLAVFGLLAPAPVPLELLRSILEWSIPNVRQALGALVNLSLLRRPEHCYEVSHPLVHTFATNVFAIEQLPTELLTGLRERWVSTLSAYFDVSKRHDVSSLAPWLSHVLPVLTLRDLPEDQELLVARLCNAAGVNAASQALYSQAEPLLKRGLEIREQKLGSECSSTAESLNNLACLYWHQGKYREAEPLWKCALPMYECLLGPEHHTIAETLNNLACLCQTLGRYEEAELLFVRALEMNKRVFGEKSAEVGSSLSNLAELYRVQGKYSEAESSIRCALTIQRKQLDDNLAISLNSLGLLRYDQGKYVKAAFPIKKAFAICKKVWGLEHSYTIQCQSNLAALYCVYGKYEETESLLEEVIVRKKRHLGADHSSTAASLNHLGLLYLGQRRYPEAEGCLQQALEIRQQQLGLQHPDTARVQNNLGLLCLEQGRYLEAEGYFQQVFCTLKQALGPMHPKSRLLLHNMAVLYWDQGKYGEAEPLLVRVLESCEQSLGPMHSDTVMSVNNLAELYLVQGKYGEAEPLLDRVLMTKEQSLGKEHPSMATSLNNLAELYQEQGRYGEAEPLYKRALEIREQSLGPRHPDTAQNVNNLAELYRKQGKYAEAEPLFWRTLAIFEQELGLGHPDTATSVSDLALLYDVQGRYGEAEPLYTRALEIWEQSLGVEHPITKIGRSNYAGMLRDLGREEEAMALESEGD